MERKKLIAWGTVLLIAALAIAGSYFTRFSYERRLAQEIAAAPMQAVASQGPSILYSSSTIPRGIPFATMLTHMGIDPLHHRATRGIRAACFQFPHVSGRKPSDDWPLRRGRAARVALPD